MVESGKKTMSRVKNPESGVEMFMAVCMARDVSPILCPTNCSPRSTLRWSQAACTP